MSTKKTNQVLDVPTWANVGYEKYQEKKAIKIAKMKNFIESAVVFMVLGILITIAGLVEGLL